jgi:hypothetical protein
MSQAMADMLTALCNAQIRHLRARAGAPPGKLKIAD